MKTTAKEKANAKHESRPRAGNFLYESRAALEQIAPLRDALNRIYDRFAPSRIVVTPGLPAESTAEDGINLPPQPVL